MCSNLDMARCYLCTQQSETLLEIESSCPEFLGSLRSVSEKNVHFVKLCAW